MLGETAHCKSKTKPMKKKLIVIISIILTFISCETPTHCEFGDEISISIQLELSNITKPIHNIHLYGFSASGNFNRHKYFASKKELDDYKLSIVKRGFTIIIVINAGEDFSPLDIHKTKAEVSDLTGLTLTDFITAIKGIESQYPDIMTGIGSDPVGNYGIMTILIIIAEGTDIRSTRLRLYLDLIDHELPHYATRAANHNARSVIEVYRKGSVIRIHSHTEILDEYVDLHLAPGEYDILLWVDYTPIGSNADHHYITSSLREVSINDKKEYVPSEDSRKAFAHKSTAVVGAAPITFKRVALELVLAKYHIVATDAERYKGYMAANHSPKVEDLNVTIVYEGFFPNSYDVFRKEPNGASLALSYTAPLRDITDSTVTIGLDYIFANDVNSFVSATVTIFERSTATREKNIITNIPGVKINHIRGHLTTVEYEYLTAGIVDQGVSIDTRWEGIINVYF